MKQKQNIFLIFYILWMFQVLGEKINSDNRSSAKIYESSRTKRFIFPDGRRINGGDILSCPQSHGLFVYNADCTKYIQCAFRRPYLRSCGPGTAFNPSLGVCDHLRNVICPPESEETSESRPRPQVVPVPTTTLRPWPAFPSRRPRPNYVDSSSFRPRWPTTTTPRPTTSRSRVRWPSGRRVPNQNRATSTTEAPQHRSDQLRPHYVNNSNLAGSILPPGTGRDSGRESSLWPQVTTTTPTPARRPSIPESLSFNCPSPNGHFADPDDCTQFLFCVRGRAVVQKCGINTYFNNRTKTCGYRMSSCKTTTTTAREPPVPPPSLQTVVPETAVRRRSSLMDIECPLPTGLFPYGKDCSRFIECWNNRPFVKSCAPGTLFSRVLQRCDHKYKVICTTPSNEPPNRRVPREVLNLPPSGQTVRLRGGEGPWEGYVQVYRNGAWNLVCDPENQWGTGTMDMVCQQLGYERGSVKVYHGSPKYGEDFGGIHHPLSLSCPSNMSSVADCQVMGDQGCDIAASAVSVECQREHRSKCPEGADAYKGKCYKFFKDTRKSYKYAKSHCEVLGGHLVDIESQQDMDWLSETLKVYDTDHDKSWHTGGLHIRSNEMDTDFWDASSVAMNFYKWWPGWPEYPTLRRQTRRPVNCITLKSHYPSPKGHVTDVDYYFWTANDCRRVLPFICELPQYDIGCYSKKGNEYTGTANVTETGKPCITWDDALATARKSNMYGRNSDQLDGNQCRNPFEDEEQPWCFVEGGVFELCDIPICNKTEKTPVVPVVETNSCSINQFQCYPGKCIYLPYVCDDKLDCPNGKDEANCTDYLPRFRRYAKYRLHGYEVEKWLHTDSTTCARRCAENIKFICKSFSFRPTTSTCVLSDRNTGLTGSLAKDNEFEYYEYEPHIINCTDMYVCDNGKCIDQALSCDGTDDCNDGSDERGCDRPPPQLTLRLVNGSRDGEGRIEVKVNEEWGTMCSNDAFDLSDAHVVCRQLGFELGASSVHTGSKYGTGNGSSLINNLACKGDEATIDECDFPGWGTQRCTTNEAASICCLLPEKTCEDKISEWMCANGRQCISVTFLCDGDADCEDGSDESALCETPEAVRLVGGEGVHPSEGRLEIRHHGVWGTVCDDEFTILDATVFCKMLGFTTGASQVITDGRFGEGKGPIWLDNLGCNGTEDCLLECPHLFWGSHNCIHKEDIAVKCSVEERRLLVSNFIVPNNITLRAILPEECGSRITDDVTSPTATLTGRVVAGVRTVPGAHPWQASLRVRKSKGSFHWCGAIILSEFYVLTAGHCLEDYKMDSLYIRVGDFDNRRKFFEEEEAEFNIEEMHVHESINRHTKHNNDIALLRLKSARNGRGIVMGDYVRPVCIPERNSGYFPGRNCTISGWGSNGLKSQYANKLHSARIPLLPIDVCRSNKLYGDKRITEGMFCAGYLEGGIDSCQGDSGGPYTCEENGRHYLYGIISWGIGCAEPNKPGVYVRVGHYLEWIYDKLLL